MYKKFFSCLGNHRRFYLLALGFFCASIAGCSSDDTSSRTTSCAGGISTPDAPLVQYSLVTVGNAGNNPDTTGFGAVAYPFQIGQYDVTIAQYTQFLNAVAKTDRFELYDANMASDLNIAGISRSGSPGNYTYAVMINDGLSSNRPIAYVNWFNAARFANWMSNGQPTGPQSASTTENGTYDLSNASNGIAVAKNECNPNTNTAVAYWIPTENEWYKAAYYTNNYASSSLPGYYLYATQSNEAPGNVVGGAPNQMNVIVGIDFSITQDPTLYTTQRYLADVGAYLGSPSYYGTFDQNGSLYQWNDLDGKPFPYRGVRGSFWFAGAQAAQSINFGAVTPTQAGNDIGFRLSSIAK